ncbi:MAG: riboflavin synthase [Vicinamibacteria bacterium]|nr:riboflavin synthase [Vicinamibacteria bacterium]
MFTGIVEETGRIESVERHADILRVRIAADRTIRDLAVGGSISVNGCCLTAVGVDQAGFVCELMGETLARTRFEERFRNGALVNLERPMRADGRFDGHIVQGHVDGVAHVLEIRRLGESAEMTMAIPPGLERYIVEKGSIAVDGISLTVATVGPDRFTVALIPHTLDMTNLGGMRPGDMVNLEMDIIAKHVERLLFWRHEGEAAQRVTEGDRAV